MIRTTNKTIFEKNKFNTIIFKIKFIYFSRMINKRSSNPSVETGCDRTIDMLSVPLRIPPIFLTDGVQYIQNICSYKPIDSIEFKINEFVCVFFFLKKKHRKSLFSRAHFKTPIHKQPRITLYRFAKIYTLISFLCLFLLFLDYFIESTNLVAKSREQR